MDIPYPLFVATDMAFCLHAYKAHALAPICLSFAAHVYVSGNMWMWAWMDPDGAATRFPQEEACQAGIVFVSSQANVRLPTGQLKTGLPTFFVDLVRIRCSAVQQEAAPAVRRALTYL